MALLYMTEVLHSFEAGFSKLGVVFLEPQRYFMPLTVHLICPVCWPILASFF